MSRPIHTPLVRQALEDGPKTNAELVAATGLLPYEVASLMGKLRRRGAVERDIGDRGRATYRLPEVI